jgi:hypothetical protein
LAKLIEELESQNHFHGEQEFFDDFKEQSWDNVDEELCDDTKQELWDKVEGLQDNFEEKLCGYMEEYVVGKESYHVTSIELNY